MNEPIIVLLSGGQDSTTCAYWAMHEYPDHPLIALTIQYGQRHSIELQAARDIARLVGAEKHIELQVGNVLAGKSPLVNRDEALEQYPDGNLPGGIEKTFVPGRNALFMTLASNRAFVLGAKRVVMGVCEEDYGGYPDCRAVFVSDMDFALNNGLPNGEYAVFSTPLMHLTKAETVELACDLPNCYPALAWSHTAYDGAYPPVGHDHATMLRAKGFAVAQKPDPLVIRAFVEGVMNLPDTTNYDGAREWMKNEEWQDMPDSPGLSEMARILKACGVEFKASFEV